MGDNRLSPCFNNDLRCRHSAELLLEPFQRCPHSIFLDDGSILIKHTEPTPPISQVQPNSLASSLVRVVLLNEFFHAGLSFSEVVRTAESIASPPKNRHPHFYLQFSFRG